MIKKEALDYIRKRAESMPDGFNLYDSYLELAIDDTLNRTFGETCELLELFSGLEPAMEYLKRRGEIDFEITITETGPDFSIKKM